MDSSFKKKRSYYLDNLSGLFIMHMIFTYHLPSFCGIYSENIFRLIGIILYFFMAWFFFKGGMCYKEKPLIVVIKKSTQRLLIPYIVFNIVGAFVFVIIHHKNSLLVLFTKLIKDLYFTEAISTNWALWFLMSLYIVRILFAALKKLHINSIVIILVSLVSAYYMHYYSYVLSFDPISLEFMGKSLPLKIPYYVGNIFFGMVFYSLGDLIRHKQYNQYVFIMAIAIYVIHFITPLGLDVMTNGNSTDHYLLAVVYCLAGIIVFNNLFKKVFDYKIPVLFYMGTNSMTFYVTHYVFYSLVFALLSVFSKLTKISINGWIVYVCMLVVTILFFYIMDKLFRNKYFSWMVGK